MVMNSAKDVAFEDISVKKSMTLTEIARIVRLARESLSLNQEEAAKHCDIGYSTYKSIENAGGTVSIKSYTKVAKAFDITINLTIPLKK